MSTIQVVVSPVEGGWLARAIVADDDRRTGDYDRPPGRGPDRLPGVGRGGRAGARAASQLDFEVTVTRAELDRFAPGEPEPSALVRRSFEFLLAREPKESILRSFGLSTIVRYYPEYEREIRRPG